MADRGGGQRLCLQLDPRMVFEALILQRLARIPTGRRQAWLRGLLVQGYLWEGRARRGVQHNGPAQSLDVGQAENQAPVSATAFSRWPTRPQPAMPRVPPEPSAPPQAGPIMPEKHETKKPFAHLRKVIG